MRHNRRRPSSADPLLAIHEANARDALGTDRPSSVGPDLFRIRSMNAQEERRPERPVERLAFRGGLNPP